MQVAIGLNFNERLLLAFLTRNAIGIKGMKDLVADIGGTNSRLALISGRELDRSSIRKFDNESHGDFGSVLERYLQDSGSPEIDQVALGVAGPVSDNKCRLTNLDWDLDGSIIREEIGANTVTVLNDLEIVAYGLIARHDASGIQSRTFLTAIKPRVNNGRIVVLGIGTGMNIAFGSESPGGPCVLSSEYGHSNLPNTAAEILRFEAPDFERSATMSVEDVLSGNGLLKLYRAIDGEDGDAETSSDVVDATLNGNDAGAVRTLRLFNRIAGVIAANIVCQFIPTDGLFVTGSVGAAALREQYRDAFCGGFKSSDMQHLVDATTIDVVTDEYAPLIGGAEFLRSLGG